MGGHSLLGRPTIMGKAKNILNYTFISGDNIIINEKIKL